MTLQQWWRRTLSGLGLSGLALLTTASPTLAVEEATVKTRFFTELLPFVRQEVKVTFMGKGDIPIAYRVFRHVGAKGGIVLVPGYSESMQKNAELIHDLIMANYNVYALDLRGMGESGRMLANAQIGHVADFNDYVEDLRTFVGTIVKPLETNDLFLIGHSTGGLVSALLLEQHDQLFKAVAWSAPMFGIQSRSVPYWLARGAIWTAYNLGYGEHYVLGVGDYQRSASPPESSDVTNSMIRATNAWQLYQEVPELRLGGPSNSWVYNSLKYATKAIADAASIQTPILLLQAGEEVVVTLDEQRSFCSKAKHCTLVVEPKAKHEIFNESDEARDHALRSVLDFFASHATPPAIKAP